MRLVLCICLLMIFLGSCNSKQSTTSKQKYYSSEEEEHLAIERAKDYSFKPADTLAVLNYTSPFFTISQLSSYTPFTDSLYFTPYQDSIFAPKSDEFTRHDEKIAGIPKTDILKEETKGNLKVFLYETYEYSSVDYSEPAINIAFSEDKGKTWNYHYTGLIQSQPIYVKWYSKLPLIKDNNTIQIEGAKLRQIKPHAYLGIAKYELIQDQLHVEFNLQNLSKDTDGDGWTDILEDRFLTDPLKEDTDNDGVIDSKDLNPRYHLPKTDKTQIYEAILDNQLIYDSTYSLYKIAPTYIEGRRYSSLIKTIMIITEDANLLSAEPRRSQIIFVSEDEYKKLRKPFPKDLEMISISSLYKVDNKKDTYKLITNSKYMSKV